MLIKSLVAPSFLKYLINKLGPLNSSSPLSPWAKISLLSGFVARTQAFGDISLPPGRYLCLTSCVCSCLANRAWTSLIPYRPTSFIPLALARKVISSGGKLKAPYPQHVRDGRAGFRSSASRSASNISSVALI